MPPDAFIGKPKQPTGYELNSDLGRSKLIWDQWRRNTTVSIQEWNSYSPKDLAVIRKLTGATER
jgi:hypothetical protein